MFEINYGLPLILVIFLTTLFLMNRLLFRPVLAVMEERKKQTSGAMQEAGKTGEDYQKLFDLYQEKLREAAQEGYRRIDAQRADALTYRRKCIADAQSGAQEILARMKGELTLQVVESKNKLRLDAQEIADSIANKILHPNR